MTDKRQIKILIVDDDATSIKMLQTLLARASDVSYSCTATQSCAQALELCRREPPDCLLLDYDMPEMDGMIFLKKLHRQGLEHVPVILVTASGSESLAVHAFKTGVQDYLRKDSLSTGALGHAIEFAIYKKQAERALLRRELDVQAKDDELDRMYCIAGHDLKAPLATMGGFLARAEKAAAAQDRDRLQESLSRMRSVLDAMQLHLDGMLEAARPGTHEGRAPVEVQLQDIAREALERVAGRIAEHGVRVLLTEEPLRLYGHRSELVCVFQNLFDNAVKFMGAQPEPAVEVGAEEAQGETVLYVRDNGQGIEPALSSRLFDMFFRADSGAEGTGIGLALVKKIVESHGGRVWVESEGPGTGACFKFTLPGKS